MADAPIKLALCVGINYEHADPRIPELRYAEADAEALAELLTTRGFTVTALIGARASRRAILMALDSYSMAAADLCLLYFSGHGLHGNRVLDRGEVYFAPYDHDPDDTMLAIPLTELATAFEQGFRARQAFALFDCCYAGVTAAVGIDTNWSPPDAGENWRLAIKPASDGGSRALAQADDLAPGSPRGRALLAACPGNVEARELADLGHGVVTYYALQGWQGQAADPETGAITDVSLYAYISDRLTERSMPPLARAAQVGDVRLDVFPIAKPAPVASAPAVGPAWPADCRPISAATIAAAQAEAAYPGHASLYDRPGQAAFWQIVAGQDVRRGVTDAILKGLGVQGDLPGMRFQLVLAAAGNGKTTMVLSLQYELARLGQVVLVPVHDDRSVDPETLAAACQATAADPAHPGRRVHLLLDNAYRFHNDLLATLTTYPIDNLTIVATARYTEVTPDSPRPAPALPIGAVDPQAGASYDALDLSGLSEQKAAILIEKIRAAGKLQAPDPHAVLTWAREQRMPLIFAVLTLTSVGGIEGYVARRLTEINNGQDPASGDRAQWQPFMRLYYPIAVCRAWGASVPQAVLPYLTGLPPAMVNALLCMGGERTGLAREYLDGTCGGTWRTDHSLIAAAVVLRIAPGEPIHDLLARLVVQLAQHPTPDAAELVGNLLHSFAVNPRLIMDDMRGRGVPLTLSLAAGGPLPEGSSEPAAPILLSGLDEPEVAAAMTALRAVARPADLLAHYAPGYRQTARYADLRAVMDTVLATPELAPLDRARGLRLRGIALAHLGDFDAAFADLDAALPLSPQDARTLYDLALVRSLHGDLAPALDALANALAADPSMRPRAEADSGLAPLRADPRFALLVAPPATPGPAAAP